MWNVIIAKILANILKINYYKKRKRLLVEKYNYQFGYKKNKRKILNFIEYKVFSAPHLLCGSFSLVQSQAMYASVAELQVYVLALEK